MVPLFSPQLFTYAMMFLWIEWNDFMYIYVCYVQIQPECIPLLLKNGFGLCFFNRDGNGRVPRVN